MTGMMALQDHPYRQRQKLPLPSGVCGDHGGRNIGYGTAEMRRMTGIGVTMAGGSLTWTDTLQVWLQI